MTRHATVGEDTGVAGGHRADLLPAAGLVLGIDVDRLTAPLRELAGAWDAQLDVTLDVPQEGGLTR